MYNDECRYEKPPPMSQIIAMAKRLQECEEIIENLKNQETSPSGPRTSMNILHQSQLPEPTRSPAPDQSNSSLLYDSSNSVEAANSEDLLTDLSLDENGKVRESHLRT